MKKLEIIIRPEKLEDLKDILTVSGVTGMMISNIMGFGNQMGYTHQYRGVTYSVNLVSKLRVETVVKDEIVSVFDGMFRYAADDGFLFTAGESEDRQEQQNLRENSGSLRR